MEICPRRCQSVKQSTYDAWKLSMSRLGTEQTEALMANVTPHARLIVASGVSEDVVSAVIEKNFGSFQAPRELNSFCCQKS